MSTWEEHMAAKVAERAAVLEAEEAALQAADDAERQRRAAPLNEAAIRSAMRCYTPVDPSAEPYGCACPGGPPGCTLCFCHIGEEAAARIEGRACYFCERYEDRS